MTAPLTPARRRFLHHTARLAAVAALPVMAAPAVLASVPQARGLALVHPRTH